MAKAKIGMVVVGRVEEVGTFGRALGANVVLSVKKRGDIMLPLADQEAARQVGAFLYETVGMVRTSAGWELVSVPMAGEGI